MTIVTKNSSVSQNQNDSINYSDNSHAYSKPQKYCGQTYELRKESLARSKLTWQRFPYLALNPTPVIQNLRGPMETHPTAIKS